jgi:T1SS-143 domain-containing protein
VFTLAELKSAVSVGADEEISFGLVETSGTLAGLTSRGEAITWSNTGGTITGVTAVSGTTVFEVRFDGSGNLVFDLDDQFDHSPGLEGTDEELLAEAIDVGQFVKATDFDGDSVVLTGQLLVSVENDVPTLRIRGEGVLGRVHEDALGRLTSNPMNNPDADLSTGIPESMTMTDSVILQLAPMVQTTPGADEPAPPVYSIVDPRNADSGLTSKGQAVTYQLSTIETNTLLAVAEDGRVVFTFSVDTDSGEVVFNLNDQLDHMGYGDNEILPIQNLGQYVQVSVTDFDGDTVTRTFAGRIEIQVENDVPTTDADDASLVNAIGGSATESFNNLPGADEEISLITFNLTEGTPVLSDVGPMTSEGTALVWHIDPATGDLQAVKSGDTSFTPVFTVTADKASGEYTGTYTVEINGTLDNGSQTITYALSGAPAGNGAYIEITGSSPEGTIFIYGQPIQGNTVNVSNEGIGVNNNFMNAGEVLSFQFYADQARTTPLALTSLGFSVDFLADAERMYVALFNNGTQIGSSIELTGAPGAKDNSSDYSFLEVTAEQAGLTAGTTFDEVRFLPGDDSYRLLFTSLVVTTEPLDQEIMIPYTVTDADGDTAQDMFSVSFLIAAQMGTTGLVADPGSDGDQALAAPSMMSASAFVPGERIEGDITDGEDWSTERMSSADDDESDGTGLVVPPGEDAADSSGTPEVTDDTGSGLVAGLSDAAAGDSVDSDPAADTTGQPSDGAPDVVADTNWSADSTDGAAGDADQPTAPDTGTQSMDTDSAGTLETDQAAGTTDSGLDSDAPAAEVVAGDTGADEGTAGGTEPLKGEAPASTDEVAGADNDPAEAADDMADTAEDGEPEGGAPEDLADELFTDAGGEEEVSTDSIDADLDAGGLDGGLDIDTLVDPGSGQNA